MNAMDETIIRLHGVSMRWDHREVLRDIDLDVRCGDFLAITGPNGGGKSTLLKVILKLIKPTSGTVGYFNRDGAPVQRLHIGYLPQKNMIDSRFPITVRETVLSGLLGMRDIGREEASEVVSRILRLVELEEHSDSPIGELSGGQLQRTLLGRALVSDPAVLVLDEPLSYIDKNFERRIYDILAEVSRRATILLVSHEMSVISTMATRHLIVDRTLHECTAKHHYVPSECR